MAKRTPKSAPAVQSPQENPKAPKFEECLVQIERQLRNGGCDYLDVRMYIGIAPGQVMIKRKLETHKLVQVFATSTQDSATTMLDMIRKRCEFALDWGQVPSALVNCEPFRPHHLDKRSGFETYWETGSLWYQLVGEAGGDSVIRIFRRDESLLNNPDATVGVLYVPTAALNAVRKQYSLWYKQLHVGTKRERKAVTDVRAKLAAEWKL